jgi:membrane protein implicated in regulation of membrane protease activity
MRPWLNWILVVAGALLILIEVLLGAVTGFDFFLIGSAVLIGGAVGLVLQSGPLGLIAAGLLSIAYLAFGRRRIRGSLKRPGLPSNVDALLGGTALVVEPIQADRAGRIRFEGEEWRALPDSGSSAPAGPTASGEAIPTGRRVRVVRVDGVTAFVVPAEAPVGGNRP